MQWRSLEAPVLPCFQLPACDASFASNDGLPLQWDSLSTPAVLASLSLASKDGAASELLVRSSTASSDSADASPRAALVELLPEASLNLQSLLDFDLPSSQDILDLSLADALDALPSSAMSPLRELDPPLPSTFLFCDDLLSLAVPPPLAAPASAPAPARAPQLPILKTAAGNTLRKRARKGRGRHRQRQRACELPLDELKHQRKLAREAATRRRARWLDEQCVLAGAMAASIQHAKELTSEQQTLQQELGILRGVIAARFRR